MYYLVLFFIAGLIQDFIYTLNLRYIAKDKIFLASLTSFGTTLISLLVLYSILARLDEERSILAIVVYALGIAIGTAFAMKVKIAKK